MKRDAYNTRRKLFKLHNQLREAVSTIGELDGITYASGNRSAHGEIKDLRIAVGLAYAMSLSIEHRILGEEN